MENLKIDQIHLFKEYIKDNLSSLETDLHLLYLIGSPIDLYKDSAFSKKNDALVPALVLVKNSNGSHSFNEIIFSWSSIDLLQTFSQIHQTGQLSYLGENEKYHYLFKQEKISVDINNVQELTLIELLRESDFYGKLTSTLKKKYQNERFLKFSSDGQNFIVPTIEVVRYFYCSSTKDSLKHSIFHPSGLGNIVERCERKIGTNRHDIFLQAICSREDYKKAFYFAHHKNLAEMFNEVYYHYKNNQKIISAKIPCYKPLQISCKTLKLSSASNYRLITRITGSNMLNSFLHDNNIDLHVHHPLAKSKEEKTGKRNPKNDKNKKVPTNKPQDFNDKLSANTALPEQYVEIEADTIHFPEETTKVTNEINGQRKEQGGKTKLGYTNVQNLSTRAQLTGQDNDTQKLIPSNQPFHISNYPDPERSINHNDINQSLLVVNILKQKGFQVTSHNFFDFPDKKNHLKKVISFIDKGMLIRRRYVLISFSMGIKKYIYIDIEEKSVKKEQEVKHNKKEILILINVAEDIAHKCVYQQVYYGNHKWLSKDNLSLIEEEDFIRIRHSATHDKLAINIKEKLSKGHK